jgi:hypothetical protein
MLTLQIEHRIASFTDWKKAFDADPINRKQSGVLAYRISQPIDDPNYVIIDLEFENLQHAERALGALRKLWEKVDGKLMFNPKTRILNTVLS